MNNREFYEKWGKSEELKIVVNAIIFKGLHMAAGFNHAGDDIVEKRLEGSYSYLEDLLAQEPSDDNTSKFISIIECYRDLTRMSDGFIKNVIKKVL